MIHIVVHLSTRYDNIKCMKARKDYSLLRASTDQDLISLVIVIGCGIFGLVVRRRRIC